MASVSLRVLGHFSLEIISACCNITETRERQSYLMCSSLPPAGIFSWYSQLRLRCWSWLGPPPQSRLVSLVCLVLCWPPPPPPSSACSQPGPCRGPSPPLPSDRGPPLHGLLESLLTSHYSVLTTRHKMSFSFSSSNRPNALINHNCNYSLFVLRRQISYFSSLRLFSLFTLRNDFTDC